MTTYKDEHDKIIFRRYKQEPKSVIAIIGNAFDRGKVVCYEHIGQHGEGEYHQILAITKPTDLNDSDVQALMKELSNIGYKYTVRKKIKYT